MNKLYDHPGSVPIVFMEDRKMDRLADILRWLALAIGEHPKTRRDLLQLVRQYGKDHGLDDSEIGHVIDEVTISDLLFGRSLGG